MVNEMTTAAITADEIAYNGELRAMQFRQDMENDCREGYVVGVDFMTMKPIYWDPFLASRVNHEGLRQRIMESKGNLYTNIGFVCEGIAR